VGLAAGAAIGGFSQGVVKYTMAYQGRIFGFLSRMIRAMADRAPEGALAEHRRSFGFRDAAVGAAVMLGLVATSVAGWWLYEEWRVGRIELSAEGEPLVVQVLAESSDTAFGEPFELASRAMLALPEGEYRLRVNGKGRLGRTYRFVVNRGERQAHTISLDEGRLLGGEPQPPDRFQKAERPSPIPFARITAARELEPGRSSSIEWSKDSLICRDGATGKVRWDTSHSKRPFATGRDPASWLPNVSIHSLHGKLLEPAADFDGDGKSDLVWYFRDAPALLALSGADGGILWNFLAQSDGSGGSSLGLANGNNRSRTWAGIAGRPFLADVDHDGKPDLLATIEFSESDEEHVRRLAAPGNASSSNQDTLEKRVLVAISGRSGTRLWSYPMDRSFTALPENRHTQLAMLVEAGQSKMIAFLDATQWIGLDPATGRVQARPIDLGFNPVRPLQHGDLDGDGEPEILALEAGSAGGSRTLHAFSIKARREIWAVDIGTGYDQREEDVPTWPRHFWDYPAPTGSPLLVDLDGDGRSEIVVPDRGPMLPRSNYRGVRLIDGATGKTRWVRPMRLETTGKDGVVYLVTAPDLDGDGTRDVVVVSRYDGRNPTGTWQVRRDDPERVFVDALSGKDGRALWWWSADLPFSRSTWIWAPLWWGRGPDGWPLLAVPLGGDPIEQVHDFPPDLDLAKGIVHVLEASTGRERHTVLDLARASVADLDADGLDDLWGEASGELRAFRGEAPELWRALGRFRPAGESASNVAEINSRGVDFDGDGCADTLIGELIAPGRRDREPTGSHTAVVRSGRDGHVIWKTGVDPRGSWFDPNSEDVYELSAAPVPTGDLDGDGTADVIAKKGPRRQYGTSGPDLPAGVELISGRTGARLWSASVMTAGSRLGGGVQCDWIEPRVVAPHGTPDLIVQHSGRKGFRMARISGRDGRTIWDVATATEPATGRGGDPLHAFADLDGDGWLDVAAVLPLYRNRGDTEHRLVVVSLRDGKLLWSQRVGFQFELALLGDLRVGDVDGDKRLDVVVFEAQGEGPSKQVAVRVIDGRDGSARWTWKAGLAQTLPNGWQSMTLGDFDGTGTQSVCVSYFTEKTPGSGRKIVILDQTGKARVQRDQGFSYRDAPRAADLNGDARDELLLLEGYGSDDRLRVWDRDLKDVWTWPALPKDVKRPRFEMVDDDFATKNLRARKIERILPASTGRSGRVIVTPAMAIDGASRRALWTGQAFLWTAAAEGIVDPYFAPSLLDPGDSTGQPHLITNGLGATVCRAAMPTEADGAIAAPRGQVWVAGKTAPDPRWVRPLPWSTRLAGFLGPSAFLVATALAFVNVVFPLLVLRLIVGRRRVFRMWALMVLPVAAAVPLLVYLWLSPWLTVGDEKWFATERRVFLVATLGGLPVVFYVVLVGVCLIRLQWRPIVALGGLTVVATLLVAAGWVWLDRKSMAALEQYGWEGWWLVFLPGAYASAVLSVFGRTILGAFRLIHRTHRGSRAV
jgi:hypothetical protein